MKKRKKNGKHRAELRSLRVLRRGGEIDSRRTFAETVRSAIKIKNSEFHVRSCAVTAHVERGPGGREGAEGMEMYMFARGYLHLGRKYGEVGVRSAARSPFVRSLIPPVLSPLSLPLSLSAQRELFAATFSSQRHVSLEKCLPCRAYQ